MKFNLHLKGYVGSYDFNRDKVDNCLADNADNDVRVLIDSTGGRLDTALSIAAAFRNHGAVDVHFVGMNASAATVASLGARTVSIDRNAMYLVHKCSNCVFAWSSMNADELASYIDELTKNKADLEKIDDNIAAMYASRCKKKKEDLLNLMKEGAWLNSKEALEWGFVDQITDSDQTEEIVVTASLANDFLKAGIPVPEHLVRKESGVKSILQAISRFFSAGPDNGNQAEVSNEAETVEPQKQTAVENAPVEDVIDEDPAEAEANAEESEDSEITSQVIESGTKTEASDLSDFISTTNSSRKLFDSIP